MNFTRVLHVVGNHPQAAVMPVDLCLSLSQRQPLYQLLSMSPLKPTKCHCRSTNCLSRRSPRLPSSSFTLLPSFSSSSSSVPSEPRSCFRRDSSSVNKKRVVFADAKGLALTAVRLFVPEPSSTAPALLMKPFSAKLQGQQLMSNNLQHYKFRLGFPQPTLHLKTFLARLSKTRVQLESCNISDHSLSGKVCVSLANIDKGVHIRLTLDSWRNHYDFPCTFLQQLRCGGSDVGVFAFELSLPQNLDPKERIEFCVSFRPAPGTTPHWDDNRGQNYRVYVEKETSNADRYYATLSKHRPPTWPWYASLTMQSSADLQGQSRVESSRQLSRPVNLDHCS